MSENISSRYHARLSLLFVIGLVLLAGCGGQRQRVAYANLGVWDTSVQSLGPVKACQGGFCCPEGSGSCQWPLALTVPPPEETYYRALVDDAAKRYSVPTNEVVLDRVTVELITEIVGTVRGWSAEAVAGRKPAGPGNAVHGVTAPALAEDRLRQLEDLHTKGLLTDEEFKERRAAILNGL